MFHELLHRHNELNNELHEIACFNHQQQESIMSKCTDPSADVLPEGGVSEPNPDGSRVGMFSLRRARYFNEAGFDATERCLFAAGIAEEAITEATTGCDQAGGMSDQLRPNNEIT